MCIICASTRLSSADDRLLARSIAYLVNIFVDATGIGAEVDAALDRQERLENGDESQ